jgi:hypothetical protein
VLQASGAYRIEVYTPGATRRSPIPWLTSNPIYVGLRDAHARAAVRPARPAGGERRAVPIDAWTGEVSDGSSSRIDAGRSATGAPEFEWRYGLKGGPINSQYAAARFPAEPGLAGFDRLNISARADRPTRVWVQLRASSGDLGERWGRTIYLDEEPRAIEVFFSDLSPLGITSEAAPPLARIDALLLVVDTVNTVPGTSGMVRLSEMWFGQSAPATR